MAPVWRHYFCCALIYMSMQHLDKYPNECWRSVYLKYASRA